MKKIFYLLACAIVAIAFNSCEKNGAQEEPKTYTVTFATSGDVNISQKPMTKAGFEEGDVIGIMAYVSDDSGTSYKPYMFGVFTDISKASIALVSGKLYKFAALLVKEYLPVQVNDSSSPYMYVQLKEWNRFESTPNHEPKFQKDNLSGYTYLVKKEYYGVTEDVAPSEGLIVNLDMKDLSAGLEVNVEWDETITGGSIKVDFLGLGYNREDAIIEYPNTSFYTNVNIMAKAYDIAYNDITTASYMSVTYSREDGSLVPIVSEYRVPFNRKKISVINIKVKESSTDASIGVSVENAEFTRNEPIDIDTSLDADDAQIGIED